jgi:hypothetical protein
MDLFADHPSASLRELRGIERTARSSWARRQSPIKKKAARVGVTQAASGFQVVDP